MYTNAREIVVVLTLCALSGFRFRTYGQQPSKWVFTMGWSDTANKGKMWPPDVVCSTTSRHACIYAVITLTMMSVFIQLHCQEITHSLIYYLTYYLSVHIIIYRSNDKNVCVY